eukprot:6474680-Pyramimonas_sp.AAC.1
MHAPLLFIVFIVASLVQSGRAVESSEAYQTKATKAFVPISGTRLRRRHTDGQWDMHAHILKWGYGRGTRSRRRLF